MAKINSITKIGTVDFEPNCFTESIALFYVKDYKTDAIPNLGAASVFVLDMEF